jgi:23S rRNA (uracil1939-C5)-methyltransferase
VTETVRILRIAAGGDGVGKLGDGRTIFIPRTAPGDLVEPAEVVLHKRFARGRIGRLLDAAPERVDPRCAHYERDQCGGCQLQHLGAAAQRQAKGAIVGEALRRIGGVEAGDPAVAPSPAEWAYRTKVTLAVAPGRIGFHVLGESQRVFPLERCEVAAPPLQRLWSVLAPRRRRLPENADRLVLRLDRGGGCHLIVEVGGTTPWSGAASLGRELAEAGTPATIWWRPEGGAARVVAGSPEAYPATVFEQVNPGLGDEIRRRAVHLAAAAAGEPAWDLYAGLGETTELLLERGATVESVEVDRRAVDEGARRSRFGPPAGSQVPDPRVRRHVGRVEEVVAGLPSPRVVITNPPRVGMAEGAVRRLAEVRPRRIVYVSCDPATLARDVARLAGAFRVASVEAYDLFPQTAHVETILVLEAA